MLPPQSAHHRGRAIQQDAVGTDYARLMRMWKRSMSAFEPQRRRRRRVLGAFIERDPKGQQANMADLVRWTAEGKLSAHVPAV